MNYKIILTDSKSRTENVNCISVKKELVESDLMALTAEILDVLCHMQYKTTAVYSAYNGDLYDEWHKSSRPLQISKAFEVACNSLKEQYPAFKGCMLIPEDFSQLVEYRVII